MANKKISNYLEKNVKKEGSLYVVDLITVSLFSQNNLRGILKDDDKYKKTPFLFLIASLNRNEAMEWANRNYKYNKKIQKGDWIVYRFDNKFNDFAP